MGRPRKPPGVGTRVVRLADVPTTHRLNAVRQLIADGRVVDPDEINKLFLLALEPGDTGGRVV